MVILDFETNSTNVGDVIEAAALLVTKEGGKYKVIETFHRYYMSKHPLNPYSLEVHELSPGRLERLREGKGWPKHFSEDSEFRAFCAKSDTLVAHNINFELRHLRGVAEFKTLVCTMKESRLAVKARNARGSVKMPKLIETCEHYGIEFDEEEYHSAIYDVTKTLEILNKLGI